MRTRTILASTTLLLATLTACSSSDGSDDKPTPTPSVNQSAAEADAGIPPVPTGAKRAAYLAAVKAVDPTLADDPDKAIDAGRNQCSALDGGGSNPDHFAAERFGNDAHPLTDDQGKALNAALRVTLCPKS